MTTRDPSVRVRFAPSPTGYLHVGGARTALFNYLFARSHGGTFVLRIEDTDQARSTQESTDQVLASMEWLGMKWDEGPGVGGPDGPYYQSQRLDIYRERLERLRKSGHVYACFCTDEELAEKKKRVEGMGLPYAYDGKCRNLTADESAARIAKGERHTWRFRVNLDQVISWDDRVRGLVKFEAKLMGDFVIVKGDGFPTYNFAVVVDDADMRINHVLRGDDHISNTPRQILIYEALGLPVPVFGHISMILGSNREKLSKRHGATSVLEFKEAGYLPDAFLNHLALLGWAPADGVEVIPRATLEKVFLETRFNAAPAVFDYAKLDFLNGTAIRALSPEEAWERFLPFVSQLDFAKPLLASDESRVKGMVMAVRHHCARLADIGKELEVFFDENLAADPEAAKPHYELPTSAELFKVAIELFSAPKTSAIAPEELPALQAAAKAKGISGKAFFKPLRFALTGSEHGLELDRLLAWLPRSLAIGRLQRAVSGR